MRYSLVVFGKLRLSPYLDGTYALTGYDRPIGVIYLCLSPYLDGTYALTLINLIGLSQFIKSQSLFRWNIRSDPDRSSCNGVNKSRLSPYLDGTYALTVYCKSQ